LRYFAGMVKKILNALAVGVALFAAVVATRPAHFQVRREISIAAPTEFAYEQVADFELWQRWSPWEGLDPALKRTYSGSERGLGARYAWVGNSQAGEGQMSIVDAREDEHLGIALEFLKPFPAKNLAEFDFRAEGPAGSHVTWTMSGENGFMGKAFGLIMDMDSLVGGDFEKGLAQLKAVAEASAKSAAAARPAAAPVPAPDPVTADAAVP
jgi:hypothetical protein